MRYPTKISKAVLRPKLPTQHLEATISSGKPYLNYWAKRKREESAPQSWHPLAYHSLDVAAVALTLQKEHSALITRFSEFHNIAAQDLERLNVFLASLHDLGKISRTFQNLVPDLWPIHLPEKGMAGTGGLRHWELSYEYFTKAPVRNILDEYLLPGIVLQPCHVLLLDSLLLAVAGHHGVPPSRDPDEYFSKEIICQTCQDDAAALVSDLVALLPPPEITSLTKGAAKALSFWLNGLINLADWIGSNEAYFKPLTPEPNSPNISLEDYWQNVALPQARDAVKDTGLSPSKVNQSATLQTIFGIKKPRPMQQAIDELVIPEGPTLIIIEDATGSGKTEAAIALAQKMMVKGKAGGLYFALPTMATANAMYKRMAEIFHKLYTPEEPPSLALAHGKRELSLKKFKRLNLSGRADAAGAMTGEKELVASEEDSVFKSCTDWISDDRRKTFFAEIGVGTIDQALMAVLPIKFQALRLWGLSNRLLIIDEAHAYDAYMSTELETLLEFHASQGGSAIVLTATLTAKQREDFQTAFENGLGLKHGHPTLTADDPDPANRPYPLISITGTEKREEKTGIKPADHTVRSIQIKRLSDEREALELIAKRAANGAAIAWVRNAVDDAINAVEQLRARGIAADLFHARFAMGDRQEREEKAVSLFGKATEQAERAGRVLVSTQVIEQSLDLDFDILISDLAPVDLLIQRAGRLWRHMDERPKETRPVEEPTLYIFSPDPKDVKDKDWLKSLNTKGIWTYKNHALLWRTANMLFNISDKEGVIHAPADLRPLLEYVYNGNPEDTPACLQEFDIDGKGEEYGDITTASFNLLKRKNGYSTEDNRWNKDDRTPPRLGEPQRTIRLAKMNTEGSLAPYYQADDEQDAWALSEVAVRQSWLANSEPAASVKKFVEATKNSWPKSQQYIDLIPIDQEGRLMLASSAHSKLEWIYGENGLVK